MKDPFPEIIILPPPAPVMRLIEATERFLVLRVKRPFRRTRDKGVYLLIQKVKLLLHSADHLLYAADIGFLGR
jgi:hypothetical protein